MPLEEPPRARVVEALNLLGEMAEQEQVTLELCLYGGRAMMLAYSARETTKDVDVIDRPSEVALRLAAAVAQRLNLDESWMNNEVRRFVSDRGTFAPLEIQDLESAATLKFRNGGLGSIVTSLSQKPGLFTKVHVHGSNGASIGVETDRGATFIAGVSTIAEPPLNDLWTVPGEEHLLAEFQQADRARFQAIDPIAHYHALQIQEFLEAIQAGRPPLVTGEDGRAVVEIFSAIYESNRDRSAVSLPLRAA